MDGIRLIDEIERLFAQLVRDPWTRPHRRGGTDLEVTLPLAPEQRGDVTVSLQGRRLIVRTRHPVTERTFSLPENAEVTGIEARFEGDRLHVRVHLRNGHA